MMEMEGWVKNISAISEHFSHSNAICDISEKKRKPVNTNQDVQVGSEK
jgi:hypothetical protein